MYGLKTNSNYVKTDLLFDNDSIERGDNHIWTYYFPELGMKSF